MYHFWSFKASASVHRSVCEEDSQFQWKRGWRALAFLFCRSERLEEGRGEERGEVWHWEQEGYVGKTRYCCPRKIHEREARFFSAMAKGLWNPALDNCRAWPLHACGCRV